VRECIAGPLGRRRTERNLPMPITQSLVLVVSLFTNAAAVPTSIALVAPPVVDAVDTDEAGVGLCKRLACTDTQRIAFLAIRKLARTQLRALEKDAEPLRPDLVAAVREAELTADEVIQLFAKREAEQHERHEIIGKALAKVHALLHVKQRKQLATILEKEGLEAVIGERPDRCDADAS
jgi:Spy/CpxP family protein refolding chaperone